MKVSIGMEKNITIIFIGFIKYQRVGAISFLEVFKYDLYLKTGNKRSFFNRLLVF